MADPVKMWRGDTSKLVNPADVEYAVQRGWAAEGATDVPAPPPPAAPTSSGASAGPDSPGMLRRFFDPQSADPEMGFGEAMLRQGIKAAGALTGNPALGGALTALGSTEAETLPGAALDTVTGAVGGKIVGTVVPPVAKGAGDLFSWLSGKVKGAAPIAAEVVEQAASRVAPTVPEVLAKPAGEEAVSTVAKAITGKVTPSPSAQILKDYGVRLTRGQMDPHGPANQLEQALESTHPHGTAIRAQRALGPEDVRLAALNIVRPPGMDPIPMKTGFSDAMGKVEQGFNRAYREVGDVPVYPAVHGPGGGALQSSPNSPGLAAQAVASVKRLTDSQRASIAADVDDLLTKLPPRKGAVGRVAADDLLEVRSALRLRAREHAAAHTPEGSAAAEAYRAAEVAISDALTSQLPAKVAASLKATDAQYRQFIKVDDAVTAARKKIDGFTGLDLAGAASKGLRGRQIERGEAGPLYDLGMAAADAFRTVAPNTGSRVATITSALGFIPKGRDWIAPRVLGSTITKANTSAMSPAGAGAPPSLPGVGVAGQQASEETIAALREFLAQKMGRVRVPRAAADQDERTRK
jgi:hypothetical protein